MNVRSLVGHTIAAALVAAVWETGIHLPAGGPGVILQLMGAGPFAFAAISFGLVAHADTRVQRQPQLVPMVGQRRPQPVRKELVR